VTEAAKTPDDLGFELDDVRAQVERMEGRVIAWACIVLVAEDTPDGGFDCYHVESVATSRDDQGLLADALRNIASRV
jgi:hypothetical protein